MAFEAERYKLPDMSSLNFYVKGVLGGGGASNRRFDKQAGSPGEHLGASIVRSPKVQADARSVSG